MLQSIRFENFKMLRDATLPLGRFTLIVGPNGSGKSTAMVAIRKMLLGSLDFRRFVTHGLQSEKAVITIRLNWNEPSEGFYMQVRWDKNNNTNGPDWGRTEAGSFSGDLQQQLRRKVEQSRVYALDANAIAADVPLKPNMELQENGGLLAGVIDRLRDHDPERFNALNDELGRWLPEYDQILFETSGNGVRRFLLRTREGKHRVQAQDLSQGTLLALAILTIAYLPDPPPFVGFEEPDRGMHPRLLRDIQDALYRLSYPESFGERRDPVQVVVTTHSPYFLDLYRDHPEEIVIAQRNDRTGYFERLSERPDIHEILGDDAPLGEVWYSGILGGVPTEQ